MNNEPQYFKGQSQDNHTFIREKNGMITAFTLNEEDEHYEIHYAHKYTLQLPQNTVEITQDYFDAEFARVLVILANVQ